MALKYADNPAAKRKMDVDEVEEGEAGLSPEDVEEGEMIEASQAPGLEGEEWEEVITNGKVIKMRKTDQFVFPGSRQNEEEYLMYNRICMGHYVYYKILPKDESNRDKKRRESRR